ALQTTSARPVSVMDALAAKETGHQQPPPVGVATHSEIRCQRAVSESPVLDMARIRKMAMSPMISPYSTDVTPASSVQNPATADLMVCAPGRGRLDRPGLLAGPGNETGPRTPQTAR